MTADEYRQIKNEERAEIARENERQWHSIRVFCWYIFWIVFAIPVGAFIMLVWERYQALPG